MSVMLCLRCDRRVDLDWKVEDWDEERDQCMRCTERDEEQVLQNQAAQAAEDEQ